MSDTSRCFDCGASRAPLDALHLSSVALACAACDPLTILYADACALRRALTDCGWPTDAIMAASHMLRSVTCAPLPRPQRTILAERLREDIYCVALYERCGVEIIPPVYGERNSMSDTSRCFDCGASRAPLDALHLSSVALACAACDPLTILYADACALRRALTDCGWPTDAIMAASHMLRSVTCAPLPRPQRTILAERLREDIYCVALYEGFCPAVWTNPRTGSYTQGPVAPAAWVTLALTTFGGEGVHLV